MAHQILATSKLNQYLTAGTSTSTPGFLSAENTLTPDIRSEVFRSSRGQNIGAVDYFFDQPRSVNFAAILGVRGVGLENEISAQSRNLLAYTRDISSPLYSEWTLTNIESNLVLTQDDTPSPFSDASVYIDPDTTSGEHHVSQAIGLPVADVAPIQLTVSCYAKIDTGASASRDHFQLRIEGPTASHHATSRFDLSSDLIDTQVDAGNITHNSASITDVGNDWKRLTLTATLDVVGANAKVRFYVLDDNTTSFVGSPPSDGMYFYGPELVIGPDATPTTIPPAITGIYGAASSWRVLKATTNAKLTDGTAEYDSGMMNVIMDPLSFTQYTSFRRYHQSHHIMSDTTPYEFIRVEVYNYAGTVDIGGVLIDDALIAPIVKDAGANVMTRGGTDLQMISESGAVWTVSEERFRDPAHSLIFTETADALDWYYNAAQQVSSSGLAYLALESTGGDYDHIKSIYGYPSLGPVRQFGNHWKAEVSINEVT